MSSTPASPPATAGHRSLIRRLCRAIGLGLAGALLSGCAVVAVVDVAASAVVGVAGLAVDAAVGTARVGGKLIGAGVDAALGPDEPAPDE